MHVHTTSNFKTINDSALGVVHDDNTKIKRIRFNGIYE